MKLFNLIALASVFVASSVAFAFNANLQVPAQELAEVVVSGGLLAPGFVHVTTYHVDNNGLVTRSVYHQGDFGPVSNAIVVVGKLDNSRLRALGSAIDQVRSGNLVDTDPNAPTGADFTTVSYFVRQDSATIQVASRGGDGHTRALPQKAALTIKAILDRAIR